MTTLVVSYTHTDEDIDRTLAAFDSALGVYRQALENGVEHYLVGRPTDVVYRRYNRPPGEAAVRVTQEPTSGPRVSI